MALFPFARSRQAEIDWSAPDAPVFVFPVPLDGGVVRTGTKLTVGTSLCAAVVAQGQVADVFGPGQYVLTADRLPGLSRIGGWGTHPPAVLEAAVYYVQTKAFRGLPWNADMPIALAGGSGDKARLRASGSYSVRVADAAKLLDRIFATNGIHDAAYLLGRQQGWLASALAELVRDRGVETEDAAAWRGQLALGVEERAGHLFAGTGLELSDVRIGRFELEEGEEAGAAGMERTGRAEARDPLANSRVHVTEAERLMLVADDLPPNRKP